MFQSNKKDKISSVTRQYLVVETGIDHRSSFSNQVGASVQRSAPDNNMVNTPVERIDFATIKIRSKNQANFFCRFHRYYLWHLRKTSPHNFSARQDFCIRKVHLLWYPLITTRGSS